MGLLPEYRLIEVMWYRANGEFRYSEIIETSNIVRAKKILDQESEEDCIPRIMPIKSHRRI